MFEPMPNFCAADRTLPKFSMIVFNEIAWFQPNWMRPDYLASKPQHVSTYLNGSAFRLPTDISCVCWDRLLLANVHPQECSINF